MITFYHIVLGLLGLSFIILIHEFGHFLAARTCKVEVERLCLFLGKPLLAWKWGRTEFAIAWLPLGGYCKMKGEGLALQGPDDSPNNSAGDAAAPSAQATAQVTTQATQAEEGAIKEGKSFQDASALQKIFIAAAGPLINILFAFVVLLLFQLGGYPEVRESNRIVVPNTSELRKRSSLPQVPSPAEQAGLQSGDTIVRIGHTAVESFQDIRMAVALSANDSLPLQYLRDGKLQYSTLVPAANAEGRGWIGIAPWRDLLVQQVGADSSIAQLGVQAGMRLTEVNGKPVRNWYELLKALPGNAPAEETEDTTGSETALSTELETTWLQADGQKKQIHLSLGDFAGAEFSAVTWMRSPNLGQALQKSSQKLVELLQMQIKGLRKLLQGSLNVKDNLAGPIQISDQIGQVMTSAGSTFAQRWYSIWQFLSLISFMIALANLLPLAVLDGGQILLFSVELAACRRLPAKWVTAYQSIGSFIVIGLMLVVLSFEALHYIL